MLRRSSGAQRVARISAFSALSVLGAFIHLPGPISSVALDSAPGFFVALYFGPMDGALVNGVGHLVTAVVNGLPLGVLHLPIALGLAATGAVIGYVNQQRFTGSSSLALGIGVLINVGLVVLIVPVLGWQAALVFAPFLALAAGLNAFIAGLAYAGVRGRLGP